MRRYELLNESVTLSDGSIKGPDGKITPPPLTGKTDRNMRKFGHE